MPSKRMLLEDVCGEFVVDRKLIQEQQIGDKKFIRIPGRFSLCDTVNGNNRLYPRRVWEKNLGPESRLFEMIKRNSAFGLLEHPRDGHIDLNSPISHLVTKATLNEEGHVLGEILLCNTAEGRKLQALIEVGYNPLVSSRGYGSLEANSDGIDIVQEDYICEGWDVVFNPSFRQCELDASNSTESAPAKFPATALSESTPPSKPPMTTTSVNEATPAVAPTTPTPPAPTPATRRAPGLYISESKDPSSVKSGPFKTLNEAQGKVDGLHVVIYFDGEDNYSKVGGPAEGLRPVQPQSKGQINMESIRTRLASFTNLDTSKITPTKLAESLGQLRDLHNQVAKWAAEDASRSYEGTILHEEIKEVEKHLAEGMAPKTKVTLMEGERIKILEVTKAILEQGRKFRKQLVEAASKITQLTQFGKDAVARGREWKALAEKLQEQQADMLEKYELATEALDVGADRYKNDMTAVSRGYLHLKFAEALAKNPELKKSLDEAKTPKDIAAIREKLGDKPAAPATPAAVVPPAPTPAPVPAPAAAPVTAPITEGVRVMTSQTGPLRISESISLARRLSAAQRQEAMPASRQEATATT
jgi:predicted DNA-binding antitoxin AbrB/MazE fold protein